MKLHTVKDMLSGLPCNLVCKAMLNENKASQQEYPIVDVTVDKDHAVVRLGDKTDCPLIAMELSEQLDSRSRSIELTAQMAHSINAALYVYGVRIRYGERGVNGLFLLLKPLLEMKR